MNSWDLITEDYEPTREELEAEGLLQMWCDAIEDGHYGMAAWLPNECIMRANSEKRLVVAQKMQQARQRQMMGMSPGLNYSDIFGVVGSRALHSAWLARMMGGIG